MIFVFFIKTSSFSTTQAYINVLSCCKLVDPFHTQKFLQQRINQSKTYQHRTKNIRETFRIPLVKMGTERYVPPQRRVQTDDSANIEETITGSVAKADIEKNNDRGGAKCKVNPDWMMKDTTQEIITFEAARLEVGPNAVESNTYSELLCTYNWISSRSSAIYVPGKFFQPPKTTAKDCTKYA